MTPESQPLVQLCSATIQRPGCAPIVRDFNWTIREGETWAIVGPSGSGKSTLAETLIGKHRLAAGELHWPLIARLQERGRTVTWPTEIVEWVSSKEQSRRFTYRGLYYQQRHEFAEEAEAPAVFEFLKADARASDDDIERTGHLLGIHRLLTTSLIKLSNGEIRRTRIARALLRRPELIILDDPFMGLDVAGQRELDDLLRGLIQEGTTRLLLISHANGIPSWVTHRLQLNGGVEVVPATPAVRLETEAEPPGTPIVELRNVNVSLGGKPILQDVSWTVREGERWSLSGPNGSGKTTLLSLLCGDHPQAFCNHVKLFGMQRGSGESVWDVKRRVGLLSPEFHLYFAEPLTATETAVTGFYDVLSRRPAQPEQLETVGQLFQHFGISHLAERCFLRLSTGEQRLVLFVRALVKFPPLLLLDEPFQGLDPESIARARNYLDHGLKPQQTLIFVTHRDEELPATIQRRIRLAGGRVVESQ